MTGKKNSLFFHIFSIRALSDASRSLILAKTCARQMSEGERQTGAAAEGAPRFLAANREQHAWREKHAKVPFTNTIPADCPEGAQGAQWDEHLDLAANPFRSPLPGILEQYAGQGEIMVTPDGRIKMRDFGLTKSACAFGPAAYARAQERSHPAHAIPGHSRTRATGLALGIGANTAIFSVVNAVLLRPLPYAVVWRAPTSRW